MELEQYFKSYPAASECFSTSDGFLFHEAGMANAHAATLKDKAVTPHKRSAAAGPAGEVSEKAARRTVVQLTEAFNAAETLEELEALFPEGDDRKGVQKAYEERKAQLTQE